MWSKNFLASPKRLKCCKNKFDCRVRSDSAIQSSKQGTRGRDALWRHKLDPSVWDQVQISLKSLLLSQSFPQTHLYAFSHRRSDSNPSCAYTHAYPGAVGSPYLNIFSHHIAARHMALCARMIGGTRTQAELIGETANPASLL